MATFNLNRPVLVTTDDDADAKFRQADNASRDLLITQQRVQLGHIIFHEADNQHYQLATYPSIGSTTGAVWEPLGAVVTPANNLTTTDVNVPLAAPQAGALVNQISTRLPYATISQSTDLDNITDSGIYGTDNIGFSIPNSLNYPIQEIGTLVVSSTALPAKYGVSQFYTSIESNRLFVRSRESSSWSTWKELGVSVAATVIVDNLTSTSTTSSLSANQGRVLKGQVDDKADQSDVIAPEWVVAFAGGFGKYANGATVPSAASTGVQVRDAFRELVLPTFNLPLATVSGNPAPNNTTEVGTLLSGVLITINFNQRDGGAATNYIVRTNGVISQNDPVDNTQTRNILFGTTASVFSGDVAYAAGTVPKNDSLGNPVANTITPGTAIASSISYIGYRRIFYGAIDTVINSASLVRTLGSQRFENSGNTFILNTGTTASKYELWLPTGLNLVSIIDLDLLNANITATYIGAARTGNDVAGNPITGTLYTLDSSVPFITNHRHQITIS